MKWQDIKRLREERKENIEKMNDTQKLKYIVDLLNKDIEMLTDCSDTHGIEFTTEYYEQQEEIEEFLNILNKSSCN